ncbi:MAG TPA: Clp protease N-terminal domain-containing protein, partial [Polyangiaceae bacterium]|nr:Clp protease N-terminal domain-containing protein [Polyangiaceae bacterium]
MSDIRREALFGKLNAVAYQNIEGATVFCKMRSNPYVELVHWVHQLLQHQDSDWQRIVSGFDIDLARLAADLTQALDKLPRGSTSVQDLSPQVDRTVERAWSFATLLFNESSVRTGHLLFALLKDKDLTPQLRAISRHFDKIGPDELVRRWDTVLKGSVENDLVKVMPVPGAGVPGSEGVAPAALGKQEA